MARSPGGSVRNTQFCLMRLAAAVATFVLLLSTQAEAQINPFRGYKGPALNSQDIALAREAARKLLDSGSATAGSSEQWENADSGHFGTITLMGQFQRSGMSCRTLESRVEVQAALEAAHHHAEGVPHAVWRMEAALIRPEPQAPAGSRSPAIG